MMDAKQLQKTKSKQDLKSYMNFIILGILLSLLPLLNMADIVSTSNITILGSVIFYAIVGIGLSILLGYSGLVSLGTAGFMGLGSYIAANLTNDFGLPFIVSLAISVAIPVLIGLVIGLVSLRLEGYYLAIATLGVSEILRKMFEQFEKYTNSFSGKRGRYPTLFGAIELDKNFTFILMVIVLVICMILVHNFINSQTGRALLTMRGSEAAAQAMGINLLKYKLIAFGTATAFAALGGVLYNHFTRYTYPDTWQLTLSLNLIGLIVIGGMRNLYGILLGSFIVFGIPDMVLKQIPFIAGIDGLQYIMSGVLLIVIILYYPQGLINIFKDIKKVFRKKKGEVNG
jgi:branched-chain amino acid transport system permease protein